MGNIGLDWVRSLGDLVAKVNLLATAGSLAFLLVEMRRKGRPRWLGFWFGFALGGSTLASAWFVLDRFVL